MDCIKIEQYITGHVSKKRAAHLYSTAQQTQALVARYLPAIPPQLGYVVGLWHDVAREWKAGDLLKFCELHAITTEKEEQAYPILLHGPVAAYLFPQLMTISPVCQTAIRWHTLGSPTMGNLGAALYTADYIEPLREYLKEGERESLLKCESLEKMCLAVVLRHQAHLIQKGLALAGSTKSLLEFLEAGEQFEYA